MDLELEAHPVAGLVDHRHPHHDLSPLGELHRVGRQVQQHLLESGGVTQDAAGDVGFDPRLQGQALAFGGDPHQIGHPGDHS